MDRKRKSQLEEKEQEVRELEECVVRILKHGDPYKFTESKVRKLAADETGIDLTDPANRKIVKLTVGNYFINYQGDESHDEKKDQAKAVACKPVAKQPLMKPEHRRKPVTFDDDDEEEIELEIHDTSATEMQESDDEDEGKPAKKAIVGGRYPGRNQTRGNEGDLDESEQLEQLEVSVGLEDEDERKRSIKVMKKKRAVDTDDDELAGRVDSRTVQRPAKIRHLSPDEEGSDEEEEEKSSRRKQSASITNKQRRNIKDVDEEEEVAVRRPRARPEKKKSSNDDSLCQLSKNRFVSVQDFNGKALVSIREYYEKDGKRLPTKKGISLTVEQWEALKKGIPDIEAAIQYFR